MSIRPCLVQCEIRPGIGAVFEDGGGAGLAPAGRHAADVHVPPIERPLGGMLLGGAGVRVPNFHRRVQIEHAAIVAPLEDLAAVDVPGQVDQQIARRDVLRQLRAEILRRDPLPDEADALGGPGLQRLRAVLEIQDRDVLQRDAEVLQRRSAACTAPPPRSPGTESACGSRSSMLHSDDRRRMQSRDAGEIARSLNAAI